MKKNKLLECGCRNKCKCGQIQDASDLDIDYFEENLMADFSEK